MKLFEIITETDSEVLIDEINRCNREVQSENESKDFIKLNFKIESHVVDNMGLHTVIISYNKY